MPKKKQQSKAKVRAAESGDDRRKTSLSQWVYDHLRQAVQSGEMIRGDRIREEQIARTLRVSRTPVKEALSKLEAAGWLEDVGAGLVIARITRPQLNELYAVREILEGSAARFAAQHASQSEIVSLKHIETAFQNALGEPDRLAKLNRELHRAIHEAAHNRYQMRTLAELHDMLVLLPGTTFAVTGRPEVAMLEHRSIIEAIERRDADEAERLARLHIRNAHLARLSMLFAP